MTILGVKFTTVSLSSYCLKNYIPSSKLPRKHFLISRRCMTKCDKMKFIDLASFKCYIHVVWYVLHWNCIYLHLFRYKTRSFVFKKNNNKLSSFGLQGTVFMTKSIQPVPLFKLVMKWSAGFWFCAASKY